MKSAKISEGLKSIVKSLIFIFVCSNSVLAVETPSEEKDFSKHYNLTRDFDLRSNAFFSLAKNFGLNSTNFETWNGLLPAIAAPDANPTAISVDLTNCGTVANTIDVTVDISNIGTTTLFTGIPIAFYLGDPYSTSATLITTSTLDTDVLPAGVHSQTFTITNPCQAGNIYVILNDNVVVAPPYGSPGFTTAECDHTNNGIFVNVNCGASDPSFTIGDFCEDGPSLPANITGAAGGIFSFSVAPGDGATINPVTGVISNPTATTYDVLYTVGPCSNSQVVTVTSINAPNSGVGTNGSACITSTSLDLTTLLAGEDAGGTWTDEDLTGAITGSIFDASATPFAGGTYSFTYTVATSSPCSRATTTIQVLVVTVPDAGTPKNETICITSNLDLLTLLDGEDAGGTWNDDDASGALTGSNFNAALTATAGGTYSFTYTVTATTPCTVDDAETVQVIVQPTPNSGTGTNTSVCFISTSLDLTTLLAGADVGGIWSDDDATGALTGSTFDASSTLAAGGTYNFTYTVAATAPCTVNAATTVQVAVAPSPNSGTGTNATVCITSTNLDLTTLLTGADVGGTWSDDDATGALAGSIFNASSTAVTGGTYNFTYTVLSPPCLPATTTVQVTVQPDANSGVGINIFLCHSSSTIDLLAILFGEDAGGVWTDDDGSGGLTGSLFNASSTLITGGTYDFTYSVTATAPCVTDASTTVQITVIPDGNSGVGTNTTICADLTNLDLNTLLTGADAGGTWIDDDVTGALAGSIFNASGTPTTGGIYDFTYSVVSPPCLPSTTTIQVTVQALPNSGVGNNTSVCITSTNLDLLTLLTGADAGGTWNDDDVTGALTGSTFDASSTLAAGGTYNFTYTVVATAPCAVDATTTVQVTVQPAANAGTGVNTTVCITSTNLDLTTLLTGADAGGTWNDDDATGALTGSAFDASSTLAAGGTYNFTYTVAAIAPCTVDATTTVQVTVQAAPNSGTGANTSVCIISTNLDLTTLLTGADAGGTWNDDDATGALTGSTFDASSTLAAGGTYNFTYTVAAIAPCTVDATTTVQVTVQAAPNSGTGTNTSVCIISTNLDLTTLLTGADAGGTWNDDDVTGALTGSTFDASSTLAAGGTYNFTYTVAAIAPCAVDATTTVQVTVQPEANAGTGTNTSICITSTNLDLTTLLTGADAGGTWNDDDATGALTGSTFDASSTLAAGGTYNFTYTVAAIAPCTVGATTTVQVTVQAAPNSGTGANTSVCITSTNLDLTTLLTGADAGGTWNDDDATGALTGSTFDASSTLAVGGTYNFTYTVAAIAPCTVDATTTVQVTVQPAANAGTGANTSVCIISTNLDLTTLLTGADAGGTWNDDDATGALTGSTFDASSTLAAGGTYNFTYTVAAIAPCAVDATTTVQVTVQAAPNSGTGTNTTVCIISTNLDLTTLLTGADVGGTWNDDDVTGALTGSTFDASSTLAVGGTYNFTYTVAAIAPCTVDATTTVQVTVQPAANAGTGANTTVCITSTNLDLTTLLTGADAGGTWNDDDATGALTGSTFDASSTLAAGGTYNFTYTVAAIAPCTVDATTTVQVTVQAAPNSGTGTNTTVCIISTNLDLTTLLTGADVGGTWNDDDVTGALTGSTFDASSTLAAGGTYNFTYTVAAIAPCAVDATTTVQVTVQPAANAGTGANTTVCITSTNLDLTTLLTGADAGGTWNDDDATGALTGSTFDASSTLAVGGTYNFTYTVAAIAPCTVDATTTVQVTVQAAPNSGTGTNTTVCIISTNLDLTTLLTGADVGGTWNDDDATGALTGSTFDASSTLAAGGTYNFTYTVAAIAPCAVDATTTVQVTVQPAANAGTGVNTTVCITSTNLDLTTLLTGADAGGTWNDDDATGALTGSTFDASSTLAAGGTYNFTYTVTAIAPCTVGATTTVQVTVQAAPNSGTGTNTSVCITSTNLDLTTLLTGADVGGTWNDDDATGALTGSTFDASSTLAAGGTYNFTYTVAAIAPCAVDATTTVQVTVQPAANAGTGANTTVCITSTNLDLTTLLTGADAGGTWNDDDATGALTGSTFDASSTLAAGGTYNFTYTVAAMQLAPCTVDATTTVQVTVQAAPNSGTGTNTTVCIISTNLDLTTLLTGADVGGTWNDDDATGALTGSTFDASSTLAAGGTYNFTYTVAAIAPCAVDATTTVQVTVQPAANAGTGVNTTVCITSTNLDLTTLLTGADAGGTWNDDDATGALTGSTFDASSTLAAGGTYNFTYTVTAIAPCTVGATTTVQVTVQAAPNSGTGTNTSVCITSTNLDLTTLLTGADVGGTWNDDDATGALTGSTFDASSTLAAGGTYNFTYTVAAIAPCAVDATTTVQVTVQPEANAGTGTNTSICITSTNLDLTTLLTGADAGGTWNDDDATGALTGSTFDASSTLAAGGTYNFTYTVAAIAPCTVGATTTVQVTVQAAPNSGTGTNTSVCITSTNLDLTTLLTGADAGGTWNDDDATGALTGSTFDASSTLAAGGTYNFTYTVAAIAPCAVDATTTVQVTVQPEANAGTGTNTSICITSTNLDLTTLLTGADAGGIWNDDDATGALTGSTFDASSTLAAGGTYNFTYTVAAIAPCTVGATTTVQVTVQAAPNSGTGTNTSVCIISTNLDLTTLLTGADAGGTWNDDDATGALTGSTFDASSTLAAGGTYNFTYTVAAIAPCAVDATTTVQVTVQPEANAGTGTNTSICIISTNLDLTTLLTGADAGGTWNDDDATGALTGSTFDASSTLAAGGTYNFTYTVAATAPCTVDATTTIQVIVESQLLAGIPDPISICITNTTVDLFSAIIGEDAGGTWNDDDVTGALTGNVLDGTLLTAGNTYNFTYTQSNALFCPANTVTTQVTVDDTVYAGVVSTLLDICGSDNEFDLNQTLIGETPDGVWNDDDVTGVLTDSLVNATSLVPGTYDFTYFLTGGTCSNASETVTVTVHTAPNPGPGSITTSSCNSSGSSIDLDIENPGADAGGVWQDSDATGELVGSIFNTSGLVSGTYDFYYVVPGNTFCGVDSALVQVEVFDTLDAGADSIANVCSVLDSLNLFDFISLSTGHGGVWLDDSTSGALTDSLLNVSLLNSSNTYTFSYVLVSGSPCPNDTAVITITADILECNNIDPVAVNDSVSVVNDTIITIDVQNNDTDANGDSLVTTILNGNGDWVVVNSDSIVYTPPTGFCGTDSIQYVICDVPFNACDTAWVFVDVIPADSDMDGLSDIFEGIATNLDSDNDNIPNYLDLDSDNDGILDSLEAGVIIDVCNPDTLDSDNDNIPDYIDLDSDNDGIPDLIENGGVDVDGDGVIDNFTDADGNGLDDNIVLFDLVDFDNDSIPNYLDLDSDNDGIADIIENGNTDSDLDGRIDDFTDTDNNGLDDNISNTDLVDTDGDLNPDYTDLDSDNDGILDIIENGGVDVNSDGIIDQFTDLNGDGADDNNPFTDPIDTDKDGDFDFQDLDSDNDGIVDADENDPNNDGNGPDDSDNDGIPDYQDIDDDNDAILTMDESDEDEDGSLDDCDEDGIPDYLDPEPCGLHIPDAFSPNDDKINDVYVIRGINRYEQASMVIFNRWGNKVYESTNGYANDWDGTNQFGLAAGSRALPEGTYFFILDLGDGSEVIKDYIYLKR